MYKKLILPLLVFTVLFSNSYAKVLTSDELMKQAQESVKTITTEELVKILKDNPNTRIIDVRPKADIVKQGGFIKANKVTNIPRGILEFQIGRTVEPDETFVVHCFGGNRSALAAARLKSLGYKNVLYYKGSFKAWKEAKLPTSSLDKYIGSMLYSKVEKVADGVYTSIGATAPGSYENTGHNNNLGFVIGNDSVLVWNAGGNYLLAKAFHEEIKKITDKPIKYVVLENSQGHAMAGSNYWKELGATIVAQEIAKKEIIHKRKNGYMDRIHRKFKDKALGTKLIIPDVTFKDKKVFDLGGRVVEARYFGYAHEHSDIAIWLPKEKILFAGDLAFNQRLLPIFEITEVDKWLKAWESVEGLKAKVVIPGHGDVTDMATVRKYTKDYLVYLKAEIVKILENDGGLLDAYNIDMSAYEHLDTFKELGRQNIARLWKQMEFDY